MADVGCAGVLVSDLFCGPMPELPQEGQLLAIDAIEPGAGGCAANVAIGLAKQGFAVDLVGCVGDDTSAQALIRTLEDDGVGCRHVAVTDRFPTSKTVILVVAGQDRRYIHTFGSNQAFTIEHVDRDWVAGLKVFYLGGLLVLPGIDMEALRGLLEFCRQEQVTTVVDVVVPQGFEAAGAVKPLLPDIDYFLPNDDEAGMITGRTDPLEQLRLLHDCGVHTAIVTLGEKGAMAVRGGQCWRIGAYSVDAVDPSGSGDAFTGGIIAGVLRDLDLPEMLRYASACGACATRALGTTGGLLPVAQTQTFVEEHPLEISVQSL